MLGQDGLGGRAIELGRVSGSTAPIQAHKQYAHPWGAGQGERRRFKKSQALTSPTSRSRPELTRTSHGRQIHGTLRIRCKRQHGLCMACRWMALSRCLRYKTRLRAGSSMKSRHRAWTASSVYAACGSRSHRCGASTLRLLRDRRLLHGLQREKESKGITPPRRAKCCSCDRRDVLALRGYAPTRCGNRTPRETRTAPPLPTPTVHHGRARAHANERTNTRHIVSP